MPYAFATAASHPTRKFHLCDHHLLDSYHCPHLYKPYPLASTSASPTPTASRSASSFSPKASHLSLTTPSDNSAIDNRIVPLADNAPFDPLMSLATLITWYLLLCPCNDAMLQFLASELG